MDSDSPLDELHNQKEINNSLRLLIGRQIATPSGFGFARSEQTTQVEDYLFAEGDGHLLTVAPTGRGKGVSVVIPTLLDYPGSVIVFDPKGENYQVTARRRRELGQRVVVLNPFSVLTDVCDGLNPLDLLQLPGADVESDAQMLAGMLSAENRGTKEPFWDNNACGVLSGVIAYHARNKNQAERNLSSIFKQFHNNDVIYNLAVLLDTMDQEQHQFAYQEIAAFLQHPERDTRPSVQSTAVSYLKCLAGGRVPQMLSASTFSLQEFIDGAPISIYVIIPALKLVSHRGLLRLIIATLLTAVLTRNAKPQHPTLFMLDEAAQLGKFPLLEQAVTLCRGYGLKVWSFWQDISQLKENYPQTWISLLNNSEYKQIFGLTSMIMARDWANLLQHPAASLLQIPSNQQLIVNPVGEELICQKLNYLTDPYYAGKFDDNPMHPPFSRD